MKCVLRHVATFSWFFSRFFSLGDGGGGVTENGATVNTKYWERATNWLIFTADGRTTYSVLGFGATKTRTLSIKFKIKFALSSKFFLDTKPNNIDTSKWRNNKW